MRCSRLFASCMLLILAFFSFGARAQSDSPPPFKKEEIDALLAPIALYPDALLSQVLMASTYPLEVVEASRWAKSKSSLKGDAAVKAAENEAWDVSVKSLVAFPNVLEMMSKELQWTQKLGDAFLAQQGDVMDSIQRLRHQAKQAGNLESSPQQVVKAEGQTIIIEPAQPQVIYVPAYNPTTAYGTWAYPSTPPAYYPGVMNWYPGQTIVRGFMWGLGFSAANALFGGFRWNDRSVDINVNRAVNIDRRFTQNNISVGGWQHSPAHRGGVAYRDAGSRSRFGNSVSGVDARRELRQGTPDRTGVATARAKDQKLPERSGRGQARAEPSRELKPNALEGVGGGRESIDRGRASMKVDAPRERDKPEARRSGRDQPAAGGERAGREARGGGGGGGGREGRRGR